MHGAESCYNITLYAENLKQRRKKSNYAMCIAYHGRFIPSSSMVELEKAILNCEIYRYLRVDGLVLVSLDNIVVNGNKILIYTGLIDFEHFRRA